MKTNTPGLAARTARQVIAGAAVCVAVLAAAQTARAQSPTIVGFLSNFDVPNNLKDAQGNPREADGFEIQIEGVQAADISYAFG